MRNNTFLKPQEGGKTTVMAGTYNFMVQGTSSENWEDVKIVRSLTSYTLKKHRRGLFSTNVLVLDDKISDPNTTVSALGAMD